MVWVGYDNPASLGDNETGAAVAAPIWHDFMAVALKDRPVLTFPQPPGVTMAQLGQRLRHGDRRVQAGPGARRLRHRCGMGIVRRRSRRPRPARLPPPRRTPVSGGVDSVAGRAVLSRPLPRQTLSTGSAAMSAESDALNEQIKQSVALLRRHL